MLETCDNYTLSKFALKLVASFVVSISSINSWLYRKKEEASA